MNTPRTMTLLGTELLLAPIRGHWLPLVLPMAALMGALAVLCMCSGTPTERVRVNGATTLPAEDLGQAAPAEAGLLEQALTASGLLELDDLDPLVHAGTWLALPGGPYLARLLDPELRVMMGLRGKLNVGGPFVLPVSGPSLIQQASPAAEDLLRRRSQPTVVAKAEG